MKNEILLETQNLTKHFYIKNNFLSLKKTCIKAVNNVNMKIKRKKTLGLVGESGSGKTTLGRTILQLIKPTSGNIIFKNQNITFFNSIKENEIRKNMQIVFQDPYYSLNPRMTIADIITEGIIEHKMIKKQDKLDAAADLLMQVGLNKDYIYRYPHEFSGGQRQRINIARAISMKPEFIICDEAVSALDVSVQAQILNLLFELQNKFDFTYLFISHDLAVVYNISDEIAVMKSGKIIEYKPTLELFESPEHDYTKKLLSAIPKI
jgi:peptide/nickel transport system ATP-binding protein